MLRNLSWSRDDYYYHHILIHVVCMGARVLHEHVGVRGQLSTMQVLRMNCRVPDSQQRPYLLSHLVCPRELFSLLQFSSVYHISYEKNTNPLKVCNSSTTFANKEIEKSLQNKLGKVLHTYRIPALRTYSHEDQKFKASLSIQCCGTILLLTMNMHYSYWLTKN